MDKQCLRPVWSEDQFRQWLRGLDRDGCCVQVNQRHLVGYCLFYYEDRCLRVWRLGVATDYRRIGVGEAMLAMLYQGHINSHRFMLTVDVHERNLNAQLFLKATGLRCGSILRGEGSDSLRFRITAPGLEVEEKALAKP